MRRCCNIATIAQNLAALQQARTDIAEAIENKGVTLEEGAGFTDFPEAIEDIPSGVDTSNDTVTPETLAEGVTAHDKSGAPIVGTMVSKVVYGIHINPKESDPYNAVTYLNDAVGMTPAKMGSTTFDYGSWENAFFMPKPCMLKSDGTVDYYLDPNDFTKKEDGTASDVANSSYDGNAMMEFPLIYYKFEQGSTEGEGNIYIANYQVDSDYKCYSNYDCDGNIIPHFYMAIYNGTGTSKLRSLSGVTASTTNGCGGTTGQQEVDRATANNTTSKVEWYTDVWCDRVLITALLYLMGKSLDLQSTYGNGFVYGGESVANAYVTGTHDTKGLFYGNTGSISSKSNLKTAVKVFGIENFWGHTYRRTAGLVTDSSSNYLYKMTYSTVDGSTGTGYNSSGSGYISQTSSIKNTGGYVSKMQFGNYGLLGYSTSSSSSSTYYCDYWYVVSSCYAFCGGYANTNTSNAPIYGFCVSLSNSFSNSHWFRSAALSCKPCAK